MSGKYGVEEIKQFLDFAVNFTVDLKKALSDGKWDWISDSLLVLKNLIKLPAAVNDMKELWNEMKDIDAEDRQEILIWAKENFDFDDEQVDQLIEDTLNLLTMIMEYANKYGK